MSNKAFIDRTVKDWRWRIARLGLTQTAFAKHVKVSNSKLSLYINKKEVPSLLTAVRIDKALGDMEAIEKTKTTKPKRRIK